MTWRLKGPGAGKESWVVDRHKSRCKSHHTTISPMELEGPLVGTTMVFVINMR